MIWLLTLFTFLATAAIGILFFNAFLPRVNQVGGRLASLWKPLETSTEAPFAQKQQQKLEALLAGFSQLLPVSEKTHAHSVRLLLRAGYHRPGAVLALRGTKVLLPPILVFALLVSGLYKSNPFFLFALAAVGGFLAPDFWLTRRIRKRQKLLVRGLADALDLLVVCVEAAMGLDQAIFRVAQELLIVHPELSHELHLVNLEMRLGKNRIEALRDLVKRTGVDDIRSLVAMLIQTDRFGTDLAQALRVLSQTMRTRRRQRTEELAVKATVKMIPALVFFIFPALFVVLLGPAVISLIREFHGTMGH